jgi:hypothetical protein
MALVSSPTECPQLAQPYRTETEQECALTVELDASPSHQRTRASCAEQPAGVDVLQT